MDSRPAKVFWTIVVSVVLSASSAVIHAQIYRCTAPDGSTMFSDRPCGVDAEIYRGAEDLPPALELLDPAPADSAPSANPPELPAPPTPPEPGWSAGTDDVRINGDPG